MNPLLRKEARLLLPAWIAALVTGMFPLLPFKQFEGIWLFLFGAAVMGLVLSPFGQEANFGTFGLLLVQPENRRRFWRIKTILLATAVVTALLLFALCNRVSDTSDGIRWDGMLQLIVLLSAVAFSGGLWTTLLFRDMVTSFFCTCLVPALIAMIPLPFFANPNGPNDNLQTVEYWLLSAYAIAGFIWARHLFLSAQDIAWNGGQISLKTQDAALRKSLGLTFTKPVKPWIALVKKELQMHESLTVLIPILGALYLVAWFACGLVPAWRDRKELVAGGVAFLWMAAIPAIIGCGAVAEERRLNTLEEHLCLPVAKPVQFLAKLFVALALSLVLGGIVPGILLRIAGLLHSDFTILTSIIVASISVGIAFYASTMSRSLLEALPTSVCLPVLVVFTITAAAAIFHHEAVFTYGSLFPTILISSLSITVIVLAFQNYQRLRVGWLVWLNNGVKLAVVAIGATLLTMGIFNRPWETFMTLEPPHGPTRIVANTRTSLTVSRTVAYAILPDGRLWSSPLRWQARAVDRIHFRAGTTIPGDWQKVATAEEDAVGLSANGTIWNISNPTAPYQIGADSDWKDITANHFLFVAIKQNGTLWGWGTDRNGLLANTSPRGLRSRIIAGPTQVGTDSDWVAAFIPDERHVIAFKHDGSSWHWGNIQQGGIDSPWVTVGESQKMRFRLTGQNWRAIQGLGNQTLAIRDDGSMWCDCPYPMEAFGEVIRPSENGEPVRVGTKSDWVTFTGEGEIAALEANGTLWTVQGTAVKKPSKYRDWIAVDEDYNLTWGLAADGTISVWDMYNLRWPANGDKANYWQNFVLGPTRRAIASTNIFGQNLR